MTREATSEVLHIDERIDALRHELRDLEAEPQKNLNAVELGRLGGLKGAAERALRLTAQQRSETARKAAGARWQKKVVTSEE